MVTYKDDVLELVAGHTSQTDSTGLVTAELVDSNQKKTDSDPAAAADRRNSARYEVSWSVDCVGPDTFLFASLANISEMGIFVLTTEPLPIGTRLMLSFAPPPSGGKSYEPFKLAGQVAWINKVRPNGDNPNPGMGVRFINLTPDDRERLVEVIRAICYLRAESAPS